jgi:LPXTG-motif cell wall-anchored protein
VGTVTVAADGTWTLPLTTPLAPGEHTVAATQTIAGIVLDAPPVTFTVVALAPPVITSPADGSTTEDTTPPVTGTGEPGATVMVTIDGVEVGTALVDADSNWQLDLTSPLSCGRHTVSAVQEVPDLLARISPPSAPVTFTVACPPGTSGSGSGSTSGSADPGGDGLAATGAGSALGLLAAVGLLLVGAGSWLVRRRRPDAWAG